jgi:sugar/nucleoside kinase (ribokinase family)
MPVTRRGILTGGTWCIDQNKLIDAWPEENGRALILESETSGGGSGSNLAIDIRKLDPDMPVATIGLIGDDADGRLLLALADEYGIERSHLQTTGAAQTDYTIAFATRKTGRRTHISYFGTSHLLTPDHFDFSRSTHRIFHLGLPGVHRLMDGPWGADANGWVTTLKKARASGLVTNMELASIDPERLADLVRPCLPHLDLLVVNDHEIGGIAGMATIKGGRTDVEACKAAAASVLAGGALQCVVVHFPTGGIVVGRDGEVIARPSVRAPSSEIVGANGAGDAFAAGFLYGWHENWGAEDALGLAHAVAAASLRQMTTVGGVESWAACLALAERWGWRDSLE